MKFNKVDNNDMDSVPTPNKSITSISPSLSVRNTTKVQELENDETYFNEVYV